MTDLTASLVISLRNERFRAGLREAGVDVQTFSRQSRRELRTVRSEFQSLTGRGLGQFRNELLGLAAGYGAVATARKSAQLDKQLEQIGLSAGATKKQMTELRGVLFDLQQNTGVKVDMSVAGVDTLLAAGLTYDSAVVSAKAIAPAVAVTNAQPDVLSSALSVGAEIYKLDLEKVGVAADLLDRLTVAGRTGKLELNSIAGIFGRVGGEARQAGMSVNQFLGFTEQLSLIEDEPGRLQTLADSTLRIFTVDAYKKTIQEALGVDYYDKDGQARAPFDVMNDIATTYQLQKTDRQRDAMLAAAFGKADRDTQRGIKYLVQPGVLDAAQIKVDRIKEAPGTLQKDLDDALNNAIAQTDRLGGALSHTADKFVSVLNRGITSSIQYLLDPKEKGGLGLDGDHLFAGGAAALAGGYGAYKYGGPMIKKALGGIGSLAGGVAVGAALEATVGVTPVYVVNMPNGITPIDGIGGRRGLPGGAGTSRHTGVGRGTPTPGLPRPGLGAPPVPPAGGAGALGAASMLGWGAVAGAGGYMAGTLINDHLIDGTEVGNAIGRSVAFLMAGLGSDAAERALEAEVSQRYRASQSTSSEEKAARLKIEIAEDRTLVKELEATGLYVDVSGMMMVNP